MLEKTKFERTLRSPFPRAGARVSQQFVDDDERRTLKGRLGCATAPGRDYNVTARVLRDLTEEEFAAFFEQVTGLRA